MTSRFTSILALIVTLVVPAVAHAQNTPATVMSPGAASFPASPDHDLVVGGQPIVTGYKWEIVLVASGQIQHTYDLGKPPQSAGVIDLTGLQTLFANLPAGVYRGRLFAYGPGGESGRLESTNHIGKFSAPQTPSGNFSFR